MHDLLSDVWNANLAFMQEGRLYVAATTGTVDCLKDYSTGEVGLLFLNN